MNLVLYTDGGSRGNPGPGAIGVVIMNNSGLVVLEIAKTIGHCTNNEAEYMALIQGLTSSKEKGGTTVSAYLDSELVVKQLTGLYKVKNDRIRELWQKVKNIEKSFANVTYMHVTRDKNKRADSLVNQALDTA